MSHTVSIPKFTDTAVLVAGDVMLDRYWYGSTSRVSPEAPVPVMRIQDCEDRLGGAANVANGIAKLGAKVCLLGAVGADSDADAMRRLAEQNGIETALTPVEASPTIVKLRALSRGQQLLRMDFEDQAMTLEPEALLDDIRPRLSARNVLVISDYAKGAINDAQGLIAEANKAGTRVVVDPKGSDFAKYRGAFLVTPNRSEFEHVAGVCESEAELVEQGLRLLQAMDWQYLLITRSEEGMTLLSATDEPVHIPTLARQVFDVTGAGDTVIATLAAALAAGESVLSATRLANLAAGVAVERTGTTTVSSEDLAQAAHNRWGSPTGVQNVPALQAILSSAKSAGERIVMTNGCFDLLHPGHVAYLEQAKALGDRLIVAVNSDASVRRLKGDTRPVNDVQQRMLVLAGLAAVDWVVPFEDDTPAALIEQLQPDVLVKGGDYTVDQIAGADSVLAAGGEVRVLDFLDGYSTSSIISKMQ